MSGIKDQERLEEVRKRLYARGEQMPTAVSHQLDRVAPPVTTSWQEPPKVVLPVVPVSPLQSQSTAPFVMTSIKKKKGYRAKILLAGFAFFMLAVVLSSMFLLFGRGGISGENISISATGPFTVGGGEQLQLQVGIINDNAVPIESATLIVDYPAGTQSATEQGKELFSERLALKTIAQGEAINVPLRASVFGEENEEKIVKVSIEYRVKGSNATFFKEAESFRFKIGSSPIVVNTDVVKKISSGQETTVTLTIRSNSPTPLSEILVQAQYPTGFDFTKSTPASTHTESMWLIKNLEPQKETKITITGVVVGKETDEYVINFTVGVPNEKDPQSLASIFATAQTQFEIEQPFLDIAVNINSSGEDEIAVEPGKRSNVSIELTNTLEDTLYDMSVEVVLSGNAFSIQEVNPAGG